MHVEPQTPPGKPENIHPAPGSDTNEAGYSREVLRQKAEKFIELILDKQFDRDFSIYYHAFLIHHQRVDLTSLHVIARREIDRLLEEGSSTSSTTAYRIFMVMLSFVPAMRETDAKNNVTVDYPWRKRIEDFWREHFKERLLGFYAKIRKNKHLQGRNQDEMNFAFLRLEHYGVDPFEGVLYTPPVIGSVPPLSAEGPRRPVDDMEGVVRAKDARNDVAIMRLSKLVTYNTSSSVLEAPSSSSNRCGHHRPQQAAIRSVDELLDLYDRLEYQEGYVRADLDWMITTHPDLYVKAFPDDSNNPLLIRKEEDGPKYDEEAEEGISGGGKRPVAASSADQRSNQETPLTQQPLEQHQQQGQAQEPILVETRLLPEQPPEQLTDSDSDCIMLD